MAGKRPPWRVFTDNVCRHADGQKAETTCGDAGARQRGARDGPSAIGWDGARQAQGTPCRTDADNPARPNLTDKSVLR
jgi:hypothetical protein